MIKHIFWKKYSRGFQSSKISRAWKSKLCTFCKPPVWWKVTQRHLLTKAEDFSLKALKVWKTWKSKLWSFCKSSIWWKTTQTHLLIKVGDFERSETSKPWKCKLCSFCKLIWWKTTQTHLWTKKVDVWFEKELSKVTFPRREWTIPSVSVRGNDKIWKLQK
mgnify:CR=1 FL=1